MVCLDVDHTALVGAAEAAVDTTAEAVVLTAVVALVVAVAPLISVALVLRMEQLQLVFEMVMVKSSLLGQVPVVLQQQRQ